MRRVKHRAVVAGILGFTLVPLGLSPNAALSFEGSWTSRESVGAFDPSAHPALTTHGALQAVDMIPAPKERRTRQLTSPSTITLNFALLVNDGEMPREVSEADRAEVLRAVRGVDEYYRGLSGGKLRVKLGRTIGWNSVNGCAPELLSSSMFSNLEGANEHVVMIKGCPKAGAAGMANKPGRRIWLNNLGHLVSDRLLPISSNTLAHELGHNLGVGHAQTEDCLTLFFKMSCTRKELATRVIDDYGDGFDVMGSGSGELLSDRERVPVMGPMNPVLSARIGLPYRVVAIEPRKLTTPRTVTIEPRTADPAQVRAVKVRMSGQDVYFSLAPNGVFDNYGGMAGDGSAYAAPTLLAHARAYAYFPGGTFLLRVDPTSPHSSLAPGVTFPIGKGTLMRIDSVDREGAQLTFMPRPESLVVSELLQAPDGLIARWTAPSDERITGYRIRLLGTPKCAGDVDYSTCLFSGPPAGNFNTEVEVDAATRDYHFKGLNGGYLYSVMVVPVSPEGEGIGVTSEPRRATTQLPEIELRRTGRTIAVGAPNQGIYLAEAAYSITCRQGHTLLGQDGLAMPDPFPILITIPADCTPQRASVTVSGVHVDGRLFRTASLPVKL